MFPMLQGCDVSGFQGCKCFSGDEVFRRITTSFRFLELLQLEA